MARKPPGKQLLGRRRRCETDIKINHKEIGGERECESQWFRSLMMVTEMVLETSIQYR